MYLNYVYVKKQQHTFLFIVLYLINFIEYKNGLQFSATYVPFGK
jgi:hypothetical protein